MPLHGGLVAQVPASAAADPLMSDSVLTAPGSPRIARVPAPAAGLVSLRLSIPLDEAPSEAGAGRVLEALAMARVDGPATALGARVESGRTPWGLVYTVTGPAADLDHLAFLLRELARQPAPAEGVLESVKLRVDQDLRRFEETGGGRVAALLRLEVDPGRSPVEGTRATVATLTPAGLRALWGRSHSAEAMTLVVVGEVADAVLLASLAGLGATTPAPPVSSLGGPVRPVPDGVQTLRRWYGVAWSTPEPLDARAAVAAVLLARRLRGDRAAYEAGVRLWETPHRTVLAVVGAAYPAQSAALNRRLDGLVAGAIADLSETEVSEVAGRIRRDLLIQARTPWGLAHLVGRFLDAGLGLDAVRRYVDRLGALDSPALRTFFEEIEAGGTATASVR